MCTCLELRRHRRHLYQMCILCVHAMRARVYVCVYIYVGRVGGWVCVHVCAWRCVCVRARPRAWLGGCVCVHVRVCVHSRARKQACQHACMQASMHACMHAHTHTQESARPSRTAPDARRPLRYTHILYIYRYIHYIYYIYIYKCIYKHRYIHVYVYIYIISQHLTRGVRCEI